MPDGPTLKVISLGAGVQSSALFLMACRGHIEKPHAAIFADTQGEPPDVYAQLNFLQNEGAKHGLPLYIVSQGDLLADLMKFRNGQIKRASMIPLYAKERKSGKPRGLIMRQCTRDYKIYPVRRKLRELIKELNFKQKGLVPCEMWLGISTDEAHRMKESTVKYITNRYPLIEQNLSRSDCLEWMRKQNYPEAPRSACYYCPYHSQAEWRRIRDNYPDYFEKAVQIDEQLRAFGNINNDTYLHKARLPLAEAVNRNDIDDPDGFGMECEGMCGL